MLGRALLGFFGYFNSVETHETDMGGGREVKSVLWVRPTRVCGPLRKLASSLLSEASLTREEKSPNRQDEKSADAGGGKGNT